MHTVVVDEELRGKLQGLAEQVELRDESGRTLGHFLPAEIYQKLLSASAEDSTFPPEEIERRFQQLCGRPLAEIWKSLGRT